MNVTTSRPWTLPGPVLRTQLGSFVVIGIASTLAYVVLYAGLRTFLPAVAANAAALLVTAVGNTAANRRLTFGVRDRASMLRDQAAGMGAFAIALAITSGAVALLAAAAPHAGRSLEIAVLVVANVARHRCPVPAPARRHRAADARSRRPPSIDRYEGDPVMTTIVRPADDLGR